MTRQFLRRFSLRRAAILAAVAAFSSCAAPGRAQDQPPKAPPPASSQSPPADSSASNQNKPQVYDPYHAMKAMEVGEFYLKKGDLDAALDRFQDAIKYKYDFARPRLLIAEIYERKHDDAQAVRYYSDYLKMLPQAPDAKKVRERIDKLSKRAEAESH